MGTRQNRLSEAVLTCTHNLCFEQKYEKSKNIQPKIVIFTDVKNRCMLHGHVFVMESNTKRTYGQPRERLFPKWWPFSN